MAVPPGGFAQNLLALQLRRLRDNAFASSSWPPPEPTYYRLPNRLDRGHREKEFAATCCSDHSRIVQPLRIRRMSKNEKYKRIPDQKQ